MSDVNVQDVVIKQLKNLFLLSEEDAEKIGGKGNLSEKAEKKALVATGGFNNKYNAERINPFNTVIYCNYLYWLSYLAYKMDEIGIAERVYYLNKALNAIDLFYETEMPDIWSCEHPVGTVIGRAKPGNHFYFYQGVNIGGTYHNGKLYYPTIENNLLMYGGSKILGNSHIGNNVVLSANALVLNQDVPSDSIVFGQSPNILIKENHINRIGGAEIVQ